MNTLFDWLASPEWTVVVNALLHSLWQGALVAAALALGLRGIRNPAIRYRLAIGAMGVLLASTIVTWSVLNAPSKQTPPIGPPTAVPLAAPSASSDSVDTIVVQAEWQTVEAQVQWTAWLALTWLIGASVMLGRASVKVAGAEQLRRGSKPLDNPHVAALIDEARNAVRLTRKVRVAVTDKLASPAVVGVLVPTLILPLSLITTLSQEQIRFILLHELAHIRRGDYLANLFQLFAEALFFFNPAVWWISHQVRREREACCDALAIQLSGTPSEYANTLVQVAETAIQPTTAAAPAFGSKGEQSLKDRVQRAIVPGYRPSLRLTWRAMLGALVVCGVLLTLAATGARQTVVATAKLLNSEEEPSEATTPKVQYSHNPGPTITSSREFIEIGVLEVHPDGRYREQNGEERSLEEIAEEWNGYANRNSRSDANPRIQIHAHAAAPTERIQALVQQAENIGISYDLVFLTSFPNQVQHDPWHILRSYTLDTTAFVERVAKRSGQKIGPDQAGKALLAFQSLLTEERNRTAPVVSILIPSDSILRTRALRSNLDEVDALLKSLGLEFSATDTVVYPSVDELAQASSEGEEPPNVTHISNGSMSIVPPPKPRQNGDSPASPIVYQGETSPIAPGPALTTGQQQVKKMLDSVRLESISFDHTPLGEVLLTLTQESKRLDPAKRGATFIVNSPEPISGVPVTVLPAATNVSLADLLGAVVKGAESPIRYSIEETMVVFSPDANSGPPPLYTRTYKVDTNRFAHALGLVGPVQTTNAAAIARDFWASQGIDLKPPKTIFYKDRLGLLWVRATLEDLDKIESVVKQLQAPNPEE